MITRALLIGLGLLAGVYGAYLLLDLGFDNLLATGTWLAGGVILHDFVLAPIVIGLCALAVGAGRWRAPLAAGLLVLGALTIAAIPVLSGGGRRDDNPTLLDQNYWVGWLVVATLVAVGVVIVGLRRSGRHTNPRS